MKITADLRAAIKDVCETRTSDANRRKLERNIQIDRWIKKTPKVRNAVTRLRKAKQEQNSAHKALKKLGFTDAYDGIQVFDSTKAAKLGFKIAEPLAPKATNVLASLACADRDGAAAILKSIGIKWGEVMEKKMCFTCGLRPARGGKRRTGSELCEQCFQGD